MNERVNLVTLVGSLLAIICYLAAPILRLAFVIGINGMNAINWLSSWFIVPVIFMTIMLVVSFVGSKSINMGVSAVTVLVLLIMLLTMKDLVAAGNLGALTGQLGAEAASILGDASTGTIAANVATRVLVNPSWGYYITLGIVIISLVASVAVNPGTAKQKRGTVNNHSTKRSDYDKLYKR